MVTGVVLLALAVMFAGLTAPATPPASGLPVAPDPTWALPAAPTTLVIDTVGGAPVISRDDYVGGVAQLDGIAHPLQIKGRGNSTWRWAKKPYKIKLDQPAALVGQAPQQDWVLLANYADRSNLRNHLALQLARRTGLAWSPDTRFVDVVLNGESLGLYLLTDQVEQGPYRVELPKGGYLLEIDERFRASDAPGFRSRRGTPVSFKDPDELDRAQVREVKQGVEQFERVLYGDDFADAETGYRAFVDLDTFVDWYLLEEFFLNQDSNFYSSVYVTWTPGGRFAMGPVWDFDLSAGTKWNSETSPQGWYTRRGTHWIARMLEDPAFSARVKERWAELVPIVDELVGQVSAAADVILVSAAADWDRWRLVGEPVPGSRHADDLAGETAFLRNWLRERTTWIGEPEVIFGRPSGSVKERPRPVWVPVRVLAANQPVRVDYAWTGGTATRGEDFTMTEGTLRFEPGETVKAFPVRILRDEQPESAEGIGLALSSPNGARLGQPQELALTIAGSDQRPDAQIRAPRGRWIGRGMHRTPGPGQTVRTAVRPGASRPFDLRVCNAGRGGGTYWIHGSKMGRGTTVRYFSGRTDVTRRVRSGRGLKVWVRQGRDRRLRAIVKAGPAARTGVTRQFRLTTVWKGDVKVRDTVRARIRIRP